MVFTTVSIFSIIYGVFYDRISKKILLSVTYILLTLSCLLFITTDNPFSILTSVSMLILGVGLSGLMVTAYFLLNMYTDDENRGLLMGVSVMISSIG